MSGRIIETSCACHGQFHKVWANQVQFELDASSYVVQEEITTLTAQLMAAQQALETEKQSRDAAMLRLHEECWKEKDRLEARLARVQADLKKYGRHSVVCLYATKCTCGFVEALTTP